MFTMVSSQTITETLESEVRSYCRSFPTTFMKGKDSKLFDVNGNEFIDFFSGAGALNYGHNNPRLKKKLLEYIENDGVTHSLDMVTTAKEHLLEKFQSIILEPRNLEYKIQFPGPTGTNCVESALKLARKVTGREKVLFFTNAFHGMTLGSLSVSGNAFKREGAGLPLTNCICMPYDGFFEAEMDTIEYIDNLIGGAGSGVDLPAAAIVETVQAEGGIHVARYEWLQRLEKLCRKYDMLLIVDDIQVGCGRTGPFFSFEPANISPDIVCLSKAISGYGLPLALTLIKPEYDQWEPGEHNGTFRGHNPAFVTASEALSYWETHDLSKSVEEKGKQIRGSLKKLQNKYPDMMGDVRGRGLLQGIECLQKDVASKLSETAFKQGLIFETSGPNSEVVKLMPPLTISKEDMEKGMSILEKTFSLVMNDL